ncbi:MAG: hypothetical protein HN790_17620, partial [Methylococcales bacterium]|nr:hypothetical protein [Methylococcales bacterium]
LNLYKAKDKQQLEIYLMQLNNQSQQQEDNEKRLAQASLKAKLATLK